MRSTSQSYSVLSLFTGAGGLDLGLEVAGFEPVMCVEIDTDSRATLTHNRPHWRLSKQGDIHKIKPRHLLRELGLKPRQLTLLAGGPPCQPFSKSMYWTYGDAPRLRDPRAHALQAYLDMVEEFLPQVLLLENVKGFTFAGKDEGLKLLEQGLAQINCRRKTSYALTVATLNAAHYGVPQFRERVFLLASIDGCVFEPPLPTHGDGPSLKPYLTAWDAIGHLDKETWSTDLDPRGRWASLLPSIPEGHNYQWHTPRNDSPNSEPLFGWRTRFWSFLLKLAKASPSWTIQAAPGPATGPFHWRSRRLSTEELCRLQTFPQRYHIVGSTRSAQRQIGNAVPSAIGELLGLEIRRQFLEDTPHHRLLLLPKRRRGCPPPEPTQAVPDEYHSLRADHASHPGTGQGPAAQLRKRTDRR